jgi:hypothetical protein
MTAGTETMSRPLWLVIEEKVAGLDDADLTGDGKERAVHRLAGELDEGGFNVSRHAGNLMALRRALDARAAVGRPMLHELNEAVEALTLEDLGDTYVAGVALTRRIAETWPILSDVDRRDDILQILEDRKLDLLVEKARSMDGDKGTRLLIAEGIEPDVITDRLEITKDAFDAVTAAIAAEEAERIRIGKLMAEVADKEPVDQARHLISHDVEDADILSVAGLEQATIDAAREAMAEELREKQRLAEEAAAAKKAAAEGPALDAIPPDEMLEHIESIREIMEFSEDPDEIRTMCEQSNIPKSLVDAVVENPDKLDELEKAAGG